MGSKERLIKKFISRKSITVEDCHNLLTIYGYSLHKSSGSHRSYHKKGDTPITVIIPKNTRYIKPGYIDKIIKKLNLEDYHEENH